MIFRTGKRVQIIAAGGAEEFEKRLNQALRRLDEARTKYELQFNPNMGFCAYLVIDSEVQIPETTADEFELVGERHKCRECPHWQHPKDGRVKYTRCPVTPGIHGAESPCCETFYEKLLAGEITLEEETE